MQNFICTTMWSPEELDSFLQFAAKVKSGEIKDQLTNMTMGMLFFNPSLRTRSSFEVGMFQLGGHALNLEVGQGMWNLEYREGQVMDGAYAEHIKEAAPVLSSYVDVLGVRSFPAGAGWTEDKKDPVISAFAEYATVPVVNMESAVWHPCQAIADALTFNELGVKKGDKVVVCWANHPKALPMAVPNSAMTVAAQRGLDVTVLRPEPRKTAVSKKRYFFLRWKMRF